MLRLSVIVVLVGSLVTCGSKEPAGESAEAKSEAAEVEALKRSSATEQKKHKAAKAAKAALADARRVPIEVGKMGYEPATVPAKPGEQLVLVFTRTADTECGRYIKLQGSTDARELPLGQPVDLPVKAPETGEIVFTCGMDMMHGIVVAEVVDAEGAAEN